MMSLIHTKNNEGGSAQQNDAHLIEFLAATAIVDFGSRLHQNTSNKEIGLKDIAGSVTFNSFYDNQKIQLFAPMTEFMMMSNCLNYIPGRYYCGSATCSE